MNGLQKVVRSEPVPLSHLPRLGNPARTLVDQRQVMGCKRTAAPTYGPRDVGSLPQIQATLSGSLGLIQADTRLGRLERRPVEQKIPRRKEDIRRVGAGGSAVTTDFRERGFKALGMSRRLLERMQQARHQIGAPRGICRRALQRAAQVLRRQSLFAVDMGVLAELIVEIRVSRLFGQRLLEQAAIAPRLAAKA